MPGHLLAGRVFFVLSTTLILVPAVVLAAESGPSAPEARLKAKIVAAGAAIQKNQSRKILAVPGELLVKFKPARVDLRRGAGRARAEQLAATHRALIKENLGPSNIAVVRAKSAAAAQELLAKLASDPAVEYVEPNYIHSWETTVPNDPSFSLLWGASNQGQTVDNATGTIDADLDLPEAWDVFTGTSTMVVGVLDSGLAYRHPDLINNLWDGTVCRDANNILTTCPGHGWNFVNNTADPSDDTGHGTHVAGLIGAAGNNGRGVVGVNWQVQLMALKVGGPDGAAVENVIKAIDFAINNGVKVLNASFGSTASSTAEYEAIKRFRDNGGVFIAAAGNDALDNDNSLHTYPSDYDLDNIISVAATDQTDRLASFSNFGQLSIDVGAPGTNIYSTLAETTLTEENFNAVTPPALPAGWVGTGDWGTSDSALDQTERVVLFSDLTHTPYLANASSTVTAPAANLAGVVGGQILLRSRCDTEYFSPFLADYLALEASGDGATFNELGRWNEWVLDDDNDPNNLPPLRNILFNLPTSTLTNAFQFRFRWVTDSANLPVANYEGCYVDDITVIKITDGADEQYGFKSGSSMAAPYVAGLAGLLWGFQPGLTATQIKDALLATGDPLPTLATTTVSGRRVNAFNALNRFVPVAPVTSSPLNGASFDPATTSLPYITFSKALDPATINSSTVQLRLFANDAPVALAELSLSPDQKSVALRPEAPLNFNSRYYFFVSEVKDTDNNTSTKNWTEQTKTDHAFTTIPTPDTIAPTSTISYSTTATTSQPVTATLIPSEPVTVTNTPGNSPEHIFITNGTFVFQFVDMAGNAGSATATVNNIIVAAVSSTPSSTQPTANAQTVTLVEDTPLIIALTATTTSGTIASFTIVTNPAHGTLGTLNGPTTTYTPAANFAGADSFTFLATDALGATSTPATVALTITPVNDAPTLTVVNSWVVPENKLFSFTVVGSDPDNDPLQYAAFDLPSGAAFNTTTAQFSWTPNLSQAGNFTARFTVRDPAGASATSTVNIIVTNVNQVPVFTSTPLTSATAGQAYSYPFAATDLDNDDLTFALAAGGPSWLTVNSASRVLSGTPPTSGSFAVTITASDNASTARQTFTIVAAAAPNQTVNNTPTDVTPTVTAPITTPTTPTTPTSQPIQAPLPITSTPTPTNVPSASVVAPAAVLGVKISRLDELIAKLKFGRRDKAVLELQRELQQRGFFPKKLKLTNYYGATTRLAVQKYQRSQIKTAPAAPKVKTTPATAASSAVAATKTNTTTLNLDQLIAATKLGTRSAAVKQLQKQLAELEFFDAKRWGLTGYYGPATVAAVKQYQSKK